MYSALERVEVVVKERGMEGMGGRGEMGVSGRCSKDGVRVRVRECDGPAARVGLVSEPSARLS